MSASNAVLGRRKYDDETEYAAPWSNAEGWNNCGGNDGESLPPNGAPITCSPWAGWTRAWCLPRVPVRPLSLEGGNTHP